MPHLDRMKQFLWDRMPEWSRLPYSGVKDIKEKSVMLTSLRKMFPGAYIDSGCVIKKPETCSFGRIGLSDVMMLYGNVAIGDYTYVSGPCQIDAEITPVSIGRFSAISNNTYINTADHPTSYPGTTYPIMIMRQRQEDRGDFLKMARSAPISIGNDVWIGHGVSILKGARIGDGAVIGANSVVTKDIEPYSIAAGTPARHIKHRFSREIIGEMQKVRWWGWDDKRILRNERFFKTDLNAYKGSIMDLIVD
jgi:virginiamycin A acetyltransferase